MNYDVITEAYRESQNQLESFSSRLSEVDEVIAGATSERETLHALIAAEQARSKTLGQHLPDQTMPKGEMTGARIGY